MNRVFNIILIIMFVMISITGCNKKVFEENTKTYDNKDSREIVKIMENVYVDYINDIYMDSSKYIGKFIEIEGMFTNIVDEDNKSYMYVYRLTDVIEHNHDDNFECEDNKMIESMCGLEFYYDGKLPIENDWIKVIGVLEERDGNLIINADSVEIIKERGLEKVNQLY